MRWKTVGKLLFVLATVLAAAAFALAGEQEEISGKVIRFHVVGASDEAGDQARKLRVRDAILAAMPPSWDSRGEAQAWLTENLALLEQAGEDAADGEPVRVTLTEEAYPTRVYDTFRLPAGRYLSLRAVVGAGEGHNWWCVVYPSLCACASEDTFASAAASAGFTDGEIRLITDDTDGITVKFRVLEWIASLREAMSD